MCDFKQIGLCSSWLNHFSATPCLAHGLVVSWMEIVPLQGMRYSGFRSMLQFNMFCNDATLKSMLQFIMFHNTTSSTIIKHHMFITQLRSLELHMHKKSVSSTAPTVS